MGGMAKGAVKMEISLEEYGKLSDRITELMLENERLRRIVFLTQSWISVKDRLPEDDGVVLAFGVGGIVIAYCFGDGNWAIYRLDKDGRYLTSCPTTIYYWMPLPEPPEEKNND